MGTVGLRKRRDEMKCSCGSGTKFGYSGVELGFRAEDVSTSHNKDL